MGAGRGPCVAPAFRGSNTGGRTPGAGRLSIVLLRYYLLLGSGGWGAGAGRGPILSPIPGLAAKMGAGRAPYEFS